jgi:magnesium transporter
MITRHLRASFSWIDLESPTPDELHSTLKEFAVHPEIEGEIIAPTPYPLVALFPGHIYLVLHFPTASTTGGARTQEIDVIVGKNFLITARYEVVGSIQGLHKAFEAEELVGDNITEKAERGYLVERVLRRLYSTMSEEVEQTSRTLERIERDIFAGKEHATVQAVSNVGRVLLRFDTTLARHAEPLSVFLETLQSPEYFGRSFTLSAAHIEAERAHVAGLVASFRAVARELRTTNDSLLSSSQNNVLKIFTGISVIILPLTLIAGVFGMHTEHEPIIGEPLDFWIIIGMMVVVSIVLFVYMRLKKWI